MEAHKKILSILYIISGLLNLFFGLMAIALFSTLFPILAEEAGNEAWIVNLIGKFFNLLVAVVIIIYSLPSFIGAVAIRNNKNWGMILLMVLGCLKLFIFPVGTALGIYTIWVFAEEQKIKNF